MQTKIGLIICILCGIEIVKSDDFPALLTANASIAVILDREYLDESYGPLLEEIQVIIEKVLREDLKNGGLIVTYYSWTSINLKKDFTAVLSVASCADTWKLFKAAKEEILLLMAMTEPDCPRLPTNEAIMIPILKTGEELPQVLLDMKAMQAFNWKSATILHDETLDRDMISRVVRGLSSEFAGAAPLSVTMFKLISQSHEWDRRKSIRNTLMSLPTQFIGRNFMVIVTTKIMESVMEIARDLGMVNTFSQWLYVISDTTFTNNNISSVSSIITEGNNVAFVYSIVKTDESCVGGINCHAAKLLRSFVLSLSKLIREEKAVYGQISDEEWEVIRPTKRERRDDMVEFIKNHLLTSSNCDVCMTWQVESGETWGYSFETNIATSNAEDASVKRKPNEGPKLLQVGYWNPARGILLTDFLFPHISNGFRGKNLQIISYHNPPWQIILYNESGVAYASRGVVIDILNELSRKLNFTYTMHLSTQAILSTANLTEDGNSTSLREIHSLTTDIPSDVLNLLGSNRVLMAAVGATVSDRQRMFLNFTIPISIQPYSFMVSRPRELSRLFLFMAPFTSDTWVCLFFTMLFMAPFLYVVHRLSPFYEHFGKVSRGGLRKIDNCFWYIYGALLQQGGMYLPEADSGRIIIGTWWLVVLVLVTTYCGNLVAFLTFPKIDIPVTTLNELINNKKGITWGIKSGSFFEDFIKDTEEAKYRLLYDGAKFHYEDTNDIIESIRSGKYVYIDWKTNLQYIMKREFLANDRCDFALSNDEFMEEQISIILPKKSPYLELINEEIKRMHQVGFIQRWLSEYLPTRDRCWNLGKVIEIVNHTVNIDDMQGSFLVLILGIVGGILLILCEFLCNKRRKMKEELIIKPYID